ncbi:MAG: hypothetical protein R6X33_14045 [Candidatus Brocadiia bacterium]
MSLRFLRHLVPYRAVPKQYRRRGYRHTVSWIFFGMFFGTAVTHGPFVIRQLGGSALHSLLLNIGQGLPLVPALFWVPLIERRNPVRMTGLFLALGGVVMTFSAFTDGTLSLSLLLMGAMMFTTLYRPTYGTSMQQIYPREWRGQLMSLPSTVGMLARVAWLSLAGILLKVNLDSYHLVFPIAGVCMITGGWLFRGIGGSRGGKGEDLLEESPSVGSYTSSVLRWVWERKPLLVFLLGYWLVAAGGVLFFNALPLYASDELGITPDKWGYANAGYRLATLLSFWFWGLFLDRFGAPITILVTWTGMGLLMGGMFFVTGWVPFVLLVVLRGLFMAGNMLAFFPIVMHFTDSAETFRGMSLHFTLWGLRWIIMPLVVVLVVDGALFPQRYLFLITLLMVAAGVAVMGRIWWRDRAEGTAGPQGS